MPLFNPTAGGGGGVPEWAILPAGTDDFPKETVLLPSTQYYYPGILYGSVRCAISDEVPDAVVWCVPNSSGVQTSGRPHSFPYAAVGSTDSGTLAVSSLVNSGTTDFAERTAQIFPYGLGFGQFTWNDTAVGNFYDTFSLWNPDANSGSGDWVNVSPPTDLLVTHEQTSGGYDPGLRLRAGGVGRDGKLYYAQLVKPGSPSDNTQPKYLSVWRFDHDAGDVYSGTWTLVDSLTVTPPGSTGTTNTLWISGGGWLGASIAGSDTASSVNTSYTLRLDGSSTSTVGSNNDANTLYPFWTTKSDEPVYYSVWPNVGAGKLEVTKISAHGNTEIVTTGIDLSVEGRGHAGQGNGRAAFSDTNGYVWIVLARYQSTTEQWVEVYRVDMDSGGAVLVEERSFNWSSSNSISNRNWMNLAAICAGSVRYNYYYYSAAPSHHGENVALILPKNGATIPITTSSSYNATMQSWWVYQSPHYEMVLLTV